jgi:outer membrane protein assembly factor BamB
LTYAVYRSSASGFSPSAGNRIASCVTGTSYDDSSVGLVSGTWYYVVQAENQSSGGTGACNGGLVSAPSVEASAFLACGSTGNGLRLLAATFRNQEAKLQWLNPDSGCPTSPFSLDIRYMTGANYPDDRAAGAGVPGLPLSQTCGASSIGSVTHLSLTNGLTYRYSAFTENTPGVWSGRKATWGQPFSTSGAEKWRYTTGATAMTPPGINSMNGGNSAVAVSNDRVLHAMVGTGTNAGEWPGSFVPYAMNAPAQARPSVIPGLTSITGHDRVIYTGAQDGRLYAFDASTGQMFASTPTALGESIQGSVTGVFTQFGGAVNRVFAATRNASGDNKAFGRNASDLAAVWEFGSGLGIGPINGDVFVDYGGQKVYFASRAGASISTVWCVTFIAGIACPSWVPPALGDIDSSPYVENGIVYVGNNSGSLHALNGTTGAVLWSFAPAVPDGSVKSFVWVDVPGNRAFYSTTNNVWAINLTSHSLVWQKDLTGLAPSAPLVLGTRLYVGLSNGKLLEVDTTSPGTTKEVQLESGTAIGEPGYDFLTQVIYVGSESGVIHAVQVPLP